MIRSGVPHREKDEEPQDLAALPGGSIMFRRSRLEAIVPTLAALCFLAGLAATPAMAQAQAPASKPPLKVTLVQAHANIAIGEEVFLYAVPQKLGYFKDEGLEVELQG